MLSDVVEQVLLARERLGAEVAAVGRLAGVPHYVIREVLLARERLACGHRRHNDGGLFASAQVHNDDIVLIWFLGELQIFWSQFQKLIKFIRNLECAHNKAAILQDQGKLLFNSESTYILVCKMFEMFLKLW